MSAKRMAGLKPGIVEEVKVGEPSLATGGDGGLPSSQPAV
jgi:hypothetical protein